jgi:hypothetical protein
VRSFEAMNPHSHGEPDDGGRVLAAGPGAGPVSRLAGGVPTDRALRIRGNAPPTGTVQPEAQLRSRTTACWTSDSWNPASRGGGATSETKLSGPPLDPDPRERGHGPMWSMPRSVRLHSKPSRHGSHSLSSRCLIVTAPFRPPVLTAPTPAPLTAPGVAGCCGSQSAAPADPTCEEGTCTDGDTDEPEC